MHAEYGKLLRVGIIAVTIFSSCWILRDGWRRNRVDTAALSIAERFELVPSGPGIVFRLDRYTGEISVVAGNQFRTIPGSQTYFFSWEWLRAALQDRPAEKQNTDEAKIE